ncbi:MAG: cadmium-translocating P-type ATPase [Candidatus Dadabacteria bacterium]|nr:MAG: cadmium-translocating P-type ATPase [Candidatus Dadabacteria bacterium]
MENLRERGEISVKGMTCGNCARKVQEKLEDFGLKEVFVDLGRKRAVFSNPLGIKPEQIIEAIEQLGYKASFKEKSNQKDTKDFSLEIKFTVSMLLTLPLVAHMFLDYSILHNKYFQLALCLPVYAIGAVHFGKSAYHSLINKLPNMDVLIFTGSTAAFFYSLAGTLLHLGPNYLFYETSASIITLVLMGNLLEHKSLKQTTSAIEELSSLRVPKAIKILDSGDAQEIDANEIQKGDILLVNTGERVPTDGEIIWGEGKVDESIVTGESVPVPKIRGDKVIGSTLLREGTLKIKATAVGNDTVLAAIIRMVESATSTKPSIQRIGDKVSAVFVPIVLLIAVVTFFVWIFAGGTMQSALMSSIAVLVISCPCAMGLATPTAVVVAIGKAARKGVLIRGGDTLEKLAGVSIIVFDKTGTITTGNFEIKKIETRGEISEDELKSAIVSLEKFSSHPIAKSLSAAFETATHMPIEKVTEMKGVGIKGTDANGDEYQVVSAPSLPTQARPEDGDIAVLKNGNVIGVIWIGDQLKENVKETVAKLKQKGIKTVLLSGDRKDKCIAIANEAGIDEVHAEKSPEEKLQIIKNYQNTARTAFVGDGINDAPALAQAEIGISLSEATEVAIQSSQVILLKSRINHLMDALNISMLCLRTIKQNLFWAFFYNVAAIPIAAFGLLNPMIAAFSMAFSDIMVVGNSLRLKIRKI